MQVILRLLLAGLASLVIGATLSACSNLGGGGTSTRSSSSTSAATAPARGAGGRTEYGLPVTPAGDFDDEDNDEGSNDDGLLLNYGHSASPLQQREISSTVRAYYAAVAADDGGKACALMYAPFAEEVLPEQYAAPTNVGTKGISRCRAITTSLFARRTKLPALTDLRVLLVRVEDPHAYAMLSFKASDIPREIKLRREGRTWKINDLLDAGVP